MLPDAAWMFTIPSGQSVKERQNKIFSKTLGKANERSQPYDQVVIKIINLVIFNSSICPCNENKS